MCCDVFFAMVKNAVLLHAGAADGCLEDSFFAGPATGVYPRWLTKKNAILFDGVPL